MQQPIKSLPKVTIVAPVFNDWESVKFLLAELSHLYSLNSLNIIRLILVNDGSTEECDNKELKSLFPISIIELNTNMGHQRSISIGLSYCNDHSEGENFIIVMDSDGEDRPIDIENLLVEANLHHNTIIFAKRQKRTEAMWFKGFYKLYKYGFKILTSHHLDFGNFSCIPSKLVPKVVSIPEIWNHYSGGMLKSRIPHKAVGTDRGERYAGTSKMNFHNLVLHGMSAISIYLDVMSVRLLIGALFCSVLVFFGVLTIVYLALFTTIPIPGWSSVTGLILITILAITVLTTFLILLFQLNQKNIVRYPPKKFYKDFILSIKSV
ncbi:glycosyltransferase [Mangrovimonas sp. DI 80]|uniref:glycosyltransferase n=1 Tax=Mangrovimonas sp. DI 80 TaxID=1779330 RepID=UPI0009755FC4|nr:glycosyltransferase [Mangrovimonas sp. DI 80]OMP31166.1 hypothetical protein BKM32_08885 [Mangrovimonas sp. DI 80]